MKAATVVGVLVGALALLLAIVALTTAPEGADEVKPQIAALRGELAGVSSRLDELDARLAKMAERISRVGRAVAKAPAPAGQVDEDRVREILRDEMRALSDRFRRGARGRGDRNVSADVLRDQVGLDQEKAEKLVQIRTALREGIGNIWREGRDRGREKNMELMRELQKKAEEEIAALLTDEEMEKYRKLTDRGGRGGREGRDRGRRDREEGHPAHEEGGGGDAF